MQATISPLRSGVRAAACGLLAAAMALVAVAASAQTQWKWRDKSGTMHISDRPPPSDIPDSAILQRPSNASPAVKDTKPAPAAASDAPAAAASPAAAEPKPKTDPSLEARKQAAEQEKAAKTAAEQQRMAAAKADNCARAKSALQTLESGIRVTRANAQGEKEYIDDAERAREAQRAKDVIAKDCAN